MKKKNITFSLLIVLLLFGRANAQTQSISWNQDIFLTASYSVPSNTTLYIAGGIVVYMAPGVSIDVPVGSKISCGSPYTAPTRFTRLDPNQRWGYITLRGDDCFFTNTEFNGGSFMVVVASRGNFFQNCVFTNATATQSDEYWGRALTSDFTPGGVRSQFGLSNCTFTGNRVGVVVFNSDATISGTQITGNTSVGVYVVNGSVNMSGSRVRNNVNISAEGERGGMEIYSPNFRLTGSSVRNNGSREIVASQGTLLYMQNEIYFGYNDI